MIDSVSQSMDKDTLGKWCKVIVLVDKLAKARIFEKDKKYWPPLLGFVTWIVHAFLQEPNLQISKQLHQRHGAKNKV